jgi:hypothetical protein
VQISIKACRESISACLSAGRPAEKKEGPFLPRFQADQGIFYSLLVKLGHVLVHVGIVIPDVSFCTSVRHCPKSERWRVVMRSLKLREKGKSSRKRGEDEVSLVVISSSDRS